MKVLVLLPEALVVVAALLALAAGQRARRAPGSGPGVGAGVLVVLVVALALELTLGSQLLRLFHDGFTQDRFALFAKLVVLAGLLVATAVAAREDASRLTAVLLAGFGAMVTASANDLVTLWSGVMLAAVMVSVVGLGAMTIAQRRLLVAVAIAGSALAIGFSLLYALSGFATLPEMLRKMQFEPLTPSLAIAAVAVLGSLVAVALLPLTGRTPIEPAQRRDTLIAAAFLSAAAIISTLKLVAALSAVAVEWAPFVAGAAALLMLAGGASAVAANTLRRLIAGVAFSQFGWVLAAALAPHTLGVAAGLFLFGVFLFALVGVGGAAGGIASVDAPVARLAGLVVLSPMRTVGLAVLLLSLAGVPPLGGWFGQFTVAAELARYGYFWLIGLGFLASAAATFATIRVMRPMFLEPLPLDVVRGGRPVARERLALVDAGVVLSAVLVAAYGLFSYPLHSLAAQAGTALWNR